MILLDETISIKNKIHLPWLRIPQRTSVIVKERKIKLAIICTSLLDIGTVLYITVTKNLNTTGLPVAFYIIICMTTHRPMVHHQSIKVLSPFLRKITIYVI